jgi:hypothetical protein
MTSSSNVSPSSSAARHRQLRDHTRAHDLAPTHLRIRALPWLPLLILGCLVPRCRSRAQSGRAARRHREGPGCESSGGRHPHHLHIGPVSRRTSYGVVSALFPSLAVHIACPRYARGMALGALSPSSSAPSCSRPLSAGPFVERNKRPETRSRGDQSPPSLGQIGWIPSPSTGLISSSLRTRFPVARTAWWEGSAST